jgi:hypothetical protein
LPLSPSGCKCLNSLVDTTVPKFKLETYITPNHSAGARKSQQEGNPQKMTYVGEMRTLMQDLRYSVRQLVSNPGVTVTALVSLSPGDWGNDGGVQRGLWALINSYPFVAADWIVRPTIVSMAGKGDWANLNGPQIREVWQLPARHASGVDPMVALRS